MAPYSDVDLMLLVGDRRAPWCEQVAEALLYLLWDLKLKIGQSVRTIAEVIGLAREDMTIRTAMLEARWIWGDEALAADAIRRFRSEVVAACLGAFGLGQQREEVARLGGQRPVERLLLGGMIALPGAALRQEQPAAHVVSGRRRGLLERGARRSQVTALQRRPSRLQRRPGHGHRHNAITLPRNRRVAYSSSSPMVMPCPPRAST
jgi:hypothetical protein